IAYEMVTGQRPFADESPVALYFSKKQGVKVKPRTLRPDLPEAAEQGILRALASDPKERYAHPTEFAEQMAHALSGTREGIESHPPKPRRFTRRDIVTVSAISSAFVAGGVVVASWWPTIVGTTERSLSYSLIVQRYRDGAPFGQPFPL